MNNIGYLLKSSAQLAREDYARTEGRVAALQAVAVSVGACEDPDEVRAQLKFERRTYDKEEEPLFGSDEWHYWKGYKEGLDEAEAKTAKWLEELTFVQNYTPPEPQYKKTLRGKYGF